MQLTFMFTFVKPFYWDFWQFKLVLWLKHNNFHPLWAAEMSSNATIELQPYVWIVNIFTNTVEPQI